MFWRNRVVKYTISFTTVFILIFFLYVSIADTYDQKTSIDEVIQELQESAQRDDTISEQSNELLIEKLETFLIDYDHSIRVNHRSQLIFIGIICSLIIVLFGVYFSKQISAPLNHVIQSTRKIIDGDYNIKLPMESNDEIGQLAMAFNRMSRQLGNQMETLLQEKDILFSIIGSMKDGVLTINLDGEIIISNPQADEFIDDFHFEAGSPNQKQLPEELNELFDSVIEKGTAQTFQVNIQGRDWDIVITPLHRNNIVQGAVTIVRDVTESTQLDQLRETFIANVSHELRTPISLMRGYSEAIIDGVAETIDEQVELAQIIHSESERMGRLVNELLDLTRLKSGHLDLNIQSHSVHDFIEKVVRKFAQRLDENRLSFKLHIDHDVDQLMFDYDRLEQVLTNLIDNAIKHTLENGEISLEIAKIGDQICFELSDTGEGISLEDLPFVFERFYMADKSRATNQVVKKGTGLGLSIVKQIIEAHRGTISVQSKLGEGTTFKFFLPTRYKNKQDIC